MLRWRHEHEVPSLDWREGEREGRDTPGSWSIRAGSSRTAPLRWE